MVGVGEWVACSGLELGTSATSDSVLLLRDQYHGRTDGRVPFTQHMGGEREREMRLKELNIKDTDGERQREIN